MEKHCLRAALLSLTTSLTIIGMTVPTVAQAQGQGITFTFKSSSNAPTLLGGNGTNGVPYSGSHWTGSSTGTTSTGETTKTTYTCVMMTQPPHDSLFQAHMLCDVKATDGTYTATMGCQFINQAAMEVSCIGGLYGTGGAYTGRQGSITNHAKGANSTGTGQWYN